MHTLVVVPTFNEAENIEVLLTRVRAAVPSADILVVDDNSPDGTGDLAEKTGEKLGQITVLRRPRKEGLGNAYRAGFRQGLDAGYKVLVQMDADLSHDPDDLGRLIAACAAADLVIGSRYVAGGTIRNWPLRRLWLSVFANRYVRAVTGLRIGDCTSGFRCWRRELLARLPLSTIASDGYAFQVEMAFEAQRAGATIVEAPITFVERRQGSSKLSGGVIAESIWMPWRLRSRPSVHRPPR